MMLQHTPQQSKCQSNDLAPPTSNLQQSTTVSSFLRRFLCLVLAGTPSVYPPFYPPPVCHACTPVVPDSLSVLLLYEQEHTGVLLLERTACAACWPSVLYIVYVGGVKGVYSIQVYGCAACSYVLLRICIDKDILLLNILRQSVNHTAVIVLSSRQTQQTFSFPANAYCPLLASHGDVLTQILLL